MRTSSGSFNERLLICVLTKKLLLPVVSSRLKKENVLVVDTDFFAKCKSNATTVIL